MGSITSQPLIMKPPLVGGMAPPDSFSDERNLSQVGKDELNINRKLGLKPIECKSSQGGDINIIISHKLRACPTLTKRLHITHFHRVLIRFIPHTGLDSRRGQVIHSR